MIPCRAPTLVPSGKEHSCMHLVPRSMQGDVSKQASAMRSPRAAHLEQLQWLAPYQPLVLQLCRWQLPVLLLLLRPLQLVVPASAPWPPSITSIRVSQ